MEGTLAEIRLFAGEVAPRNWEFCRGQLIDIKDNIPLFCLIYIRFGGDGLINFALPRLECCIAINSGYDKGGVGASCQQGNKENSESKVDESIFVAQPYRTMNYIICTHGSYPVRPW